MKFSLAALAKQRNPRLKSKTLRPIIAPRTFANELARINAEAAQYWSNVTPQIEAAYARALFQLTTDAAADDMETTLDVLSQESGRIVLLLTPRMRLWAERVSRWHLSKWVASVLSASNVDLSSILSTGDVEETVATVLRRNVSLVRDVSDTIRGKIADTVFRGLQARTPVRDVAREMREVTGLQRARAVRIASHQSSQLAGALDRERMKQAGLDKYVWVSSGKVNAREEHAARNGNVYALGEPSDQPSDLPNCGCHAGPYLDMTD